MQYCVHIYWNSWGQGNMLFANRATLSEAKEKIAEEFRRVPSFEYAEIYDRTTGETIYRTRHDSEYKKVNN